MLANARRAERRDAMAPSTMRAEGSSPHDVTVLDLSATGIRIRSGAALALGQEISIGLAGAGATRAYVAWQRGDEYGCAFAKPLSAEDEARAFSNASPILLGRAGPAPVITPEHTKPDANGLEELYRQHRTWALPPDAILAILTFGGIAFWALRLLHH